MRQTLTHPTPRPTQRGSALIIGIIFLLVMTMLGLTAMQTTSLEERMAGNMRDRNLAAQSAELALRLGEEDILDNSAPAGQGVYDLHANPAPDESVAANWTAGNTLPWPGTAGAPPAGAPLFWIEQRPSVKSTTSLESSTPADVAIYEVTARSAGASGTSPVILRSTVMQ